MPRSALNVTTESSTIMNLPYSDWQTNCSPEVKTQAIQSLEEGQVIFFPNLMFQVSAEEARLLSPDFVAPKSKNISYNPLLDRIQGVDGSSEDKQQFKGLLQRFLSHAQRLITDLFPTYKTGLQRGRTSFRPVQVSHRKTSYRKNDRLLHVDAFPANPNQGKRILRVFSNINPNGQDRVWRIGESFEQVAQRFLPHIHPSFPGSRQLLKLLGITRGLRSEYDHLMLQLHDRMKKDSDYQQHAIQTEVRFPSGSTWIVQTDKTSHAALSGQYLLEQTFYLPITSMADPEKSPLYILEKLSGRTLHLT